MKDIARLSLIIGPFIISIMLSYLGYIAIGFSVLCLGIASGHWLLDDWKSDR